MNPTPSLIHPIDLNEITESIGSTTLTKSIKTKQPIEPIKKKKSIRFDESVRSHDGMEYNKQSFSRVLVDYFVRRSYKTLYEIIDLKDLNTLRYVYKQVRILTNKCILKPTIVIIARGQELRFQTDHTPHLFNIGLKIKHHLDLHDST